MKVHDVGAEASSVDEETQQPRHQKAEASTSYFVRGSPYQGWTIVHGDLPGWRGSGPTSSADASPTRNMNQTDGAK